LADMRAPGIVACQVGLQFTSLVEFPDQGESPIETILGEQRPDRVAIPPLFIQGATRVEVRITLDSGVDRHEPSAPGETVIGEDLDQLVEGSVAVSEGIGGLRDQAVVPVAVA
jgi:hypothetical protein